MIPPPPPPLQVFQKFIRIWEASLNHLDIFVFPDLLLDEKQKSLNILFFSCSTCFNRHMRRSTRCHVETFSEKGSLKYFLIIAVSYSEARMISARLPSDVRRSSEDLQKITTSNNFHPANMNTEKYCLTRNIFSVFSY